MGFTLKGGAAVDGSCFEKPSEMAAAGDCPGGPGEEAVRGKRAFAVYSDADKSLRFYNRAEVPEEGEDFEGRTVGAVYKAEAFDGHRWGELAADVETVSVVDEGVAPRFTAYWFYGFDRMTSCDLGKLDTSNVAGMDWMFAGCASIAGLDLSGFDTSGVVDMSWMFAGCRALRSLDLSGFETSRVEEMTGMFDGCSSLETLDLSGFDTARVESMAEMFHGCWSLESLDLSSFDTSGVRDCYAMFAGCDSLKELDVSSFDTSRVDDMRRMFAGCSSLKALDLSGFDFREGVKLGAFAVFCEAAGVGAYRR